VAGKTGTTNNNYGRYFVGYTPYYCAAVWVGYGYNEYIKADGNPAANLWQKVMSQVHEGLENKDFNVPSSGLTSVRTCVASGLLPGEGCTTQSVKVLEGSAPTEVCTMHQAVEICTESGMLATEYCPPECREVRYLHNYQRENLVIPNGATSIDPLTGLEVVTGTPILAEDDGYMLQSVLAAGSCTTHDFWSGMGGWFDPEYWDPNDPTVPNWPNQEEIEGGLTPGEPETPGEPGEGNTSNGFFDWLNNLGL